jgi:hypothetical protein
LVADANAEIGDVHRKTGLSPGGMKAFERRQRNPYALALRTLLNPSCIRWEKLTLGSLTSRAIWSAAEKPDADAAVVGRGLIARGNQYDPVKD